MKRISDPLTEMGAHFTLTNSKFPPVSVEGVPHLKAISYALPVASAQLKSALLLAGLFAEGTTELTGQIGSRDHTEKLFPHYGVSLSVSDKKISLKGNQTLKANSYHIPGDPSSSAFWIAAAGIVPGSKICIQNVLLNPTRIGFIEVLRRMGLKISTSVKFENPECVGDISVQGGSPLKGTVVTPEEVPSLIDEIPMLAVLATFAKGRTEIRGAEELRIKETDRIEAIAENLRKMGVKVETFNDGLAIEGPAPLKGCVLDSKHDHRIAMAFAIGALGASGTTTIEHFDAVGISYPEFLSTLGRLTGEAQ